MAKYGARDYACSHAFASQCLRGSAGGSADCVTCSRIARAVRGRSLLGKVDKLVGWNQSLRRMSPTQQRFAAGDPSGPHIDQRLIEYSQLPGVQRLTTVELQNATRLHCPIHRGLEQPIDTAPVDLGAVQRQVGAFQQPIGIRPVLRRERNTDTGADDDVMSVDLEWSLDQLDPSACRRHGFLRHEGWSHDRQLGATHFIMAT